MTGNTAYWAKQWAEYNYTVNQIAGAGLWNPQYRLFFRDPTYFNKTTPSGTPVLWARGNGWAIAALARTIEALPPGHEQLPEYTAKLVAMAAALKAVQVRAVSPLPPLSFPCTAAAAMPLTGPRRNVARLTGRLQRVPQPRDDRHLALHLRPRLGRQQRCVAPRVPVPQARSAPRAHQPSLAGLLSSAVYTPVVAKAWQGLSTIALQPNGFVGYCQPPNGQPAPAYSNQTSDFCVGQFLLAGSEVSKMAARLA